MDFLASLEIVTIIFAKVAYAADCTTIPSAAQFSSTNPVCFVTINSLFQSLSSSSSDGGAICVSAASYANLSVSSSFFLSCSSSYSEGGAIFFSGASFVLRRSCFLYCFCSNIAQSFSDTVTNTSDVSTVSVCQCASSSSLGKYHAFITYQGSIKYSNVNSSNNYVFYDAAGATLSSANSGVTQYLNVYNCSGLIVVFFSSVSDGTMAQSSIINSAVSPNTYGILTSRSSGLTVSDCEFSGNSATYLFCSVSQAFVVSNSIVDISSTAFSNVTLISVSFGQSISIPYLSLNSYVGGHACALPSYFPNTTKLFTNTAYPAVVSRILIISQLLFAL